jgi:divalent metal cation (Fe/Co/Zn/Cd) transporter
MDEHVYDDLIVQIREVAHRVPGVIDTEKCFIRKSGMKYHVDLHAVVNGQISVKDGHDIAHQLKDTLRTELPALGHVLIHIEPHYAGL